MKKSLVSWLGTVGFLSVFLAAGNACTIPVFRYALDRWPPDPYLLIVPQEQIAAIPAPIVAEAKRGDLNLTISGKEGASLELRFPETQGGAKWPFPFSVQDLPAMTQSLARTEIARRIVNGEAAVFVAEIGGDPAKDEEVLRNLDERLRFLEKNASLPEQDPKDPESILRPGPPLRIGFSILPLRWDDPREKALLTILRGGLTKEALKEAESGKGGPYVYPVFGQGRVLAAMAPEEVKNENIDAVCMFLLDACSCQVKELNPGWDLLIHFDWDRALEEVAKTGAWGSPTAWQEREMMPKASTGYEKAEGEALEGESNIIQQNTIWVALAIGALLLCLILAAILIAKR